MKKSDLLNRLYEKFPEYSKSEIAKVLNGTFDAMIDALSKGERIEIRGLGSFRVKERKAEKARNPKTGEIITLKNKKVVQFKMGKKLKRILFKKVKA